MKRYWFVLDDTNPYGPNNVGVTANSINEAKELAIEELKTLQLIDRIKSIAVCKNIMENIDIQLLDKGHVIPNMGIVTFKGVWWPRLS